MFDPTPEGLGFHMQTFTIKVTAMLNFLGLSDFMCSDPGRVQRKAEEEKQSLEKTINPPNCWVHG